jgi:hypothetical protein
VGPSRAAGVEASDEIVEVWWPNRGIAAAFESEHVFTIRHSVIDA